MFVYGQKLLFSGRGFFRAKWFNLGKVVEFGQKWLYSGKVVVFGKMVVFRQKWLYLGKSCCIRAILLVFVQDGCVRQKLFYSVNVVIFRQKWL